MALTKLQAIEINKENLGAVRLKAATVFTTPASGIRLAKAASRSPLPAVLLIIKYCLPAAGTAGA
ncbi:MAG: hypothetical protein KIT15_13825 [Xanthobacteraceae bacterium]|nr:hypothetical protein [Xanthobacteraceae bacterium]MCW5675651.1 hypothetical protein [Xanthobacteraceae bacterium]